MCRGGVGTNKRKSAPASPVARPALLGDIRALIEVSRQRVASAVNSELALLFWRIGHRIHTYFLNGQRAGYGEEILPTLAAQLVRDYGRSFADKNLRRMVQFATAFPEEPIVVTLSRQLSWSHFVALLPLKDALQRDYYVLMASAERWSVRTLRERIDSMLYERTTLSRKPDALIAQELDTMRDAQRMSPSLVMRDPYILDFLGLRDAWQEGDLEAAIGAGLAGRNPARRRSRPRQGRGSQGADGQGAVRPVHGRPLQAPQQTEHAGRLPVPDRQLRHPSLWQQEGTRGHAPHDITALMKRMEKSPTHANRVLSLVRKMFNLAELWGYRHDGANPCRHVPKYPEKGGDMSKPLSEEARRLLTNAPRYGKSPYVCPAILDHDKPLGPHSNCPMPPCARRFRRWKAV
jgi:hypothetical protein